MIMFARVELTIHKTLPTLPVYKKRAESRRQPAPSAGEWPRHPTAARRPPPPMIRRLQHADSRQHCRRRNHRQQLRHYRSSHRLPSHCQDHRRNYKSRHHPSSRNQLHRLLLQSPHVLRNQESSRRSTPQHNQHITSTSRWRMNTDTENIYWPSADQHSILA